MNAMREFITGTEKAEKTEKRINVTLVRSEEKAEIKEADKMTKEYLNEKLYYFYNNGGPVMDI
ncbi:MAG: hypothetical protein ACM3NJ_00720 [Methanobacterium sp.]